MKSDISAAQTKVTVRNLQRRIQIDVVDLEQFAAKAVSLCLRLPHRKKSDLEQLPQVSVLIVSDRRIASIHRRFMNESGPTDVITFQHGEIFISAETARRNARRYGNSLKRELALCIVHGLLHLHGLDDRTRADARNMKTVQERILARASRLK